MTTIAKQQEQDDLLEEIADCRACANTSFGFCDKHRLKFDKITLEIYPLGRRFVRLAYRAKELGYVPKGNLYD